MGENTKISWTDHSFNPWMGCAKISDGCRSCYAEEFTTNRMGLRLWGLGAQRKVTTSVWGDPPKWNRKAEKEGVRRRVFCASLADVFEDRPDLNDPRERLFRLIEETPHLDWLLLTKRPGAMVPLARRAGWKGPWPENVWAGTTVEHQAAADARIPHLRKVPAVVRFLSVEPQLEAIDLSTHLQSECPCHYYRRGEYMQHAPSCDSDFCVMAAGFYDCDGRLVRCGCDGISWVIQGGESGGRARPFDLAWARTLREQCRDNSVPYLFKQLGDNPVVQVDGRITTWPSKAPKGGDVAEWPEDLRVQEFPEVVR